MPCLVLNRRGQASLADPAGQEFSSVWVPQKVGIEPYAPRTADRWGFGTGCRQRVGESVAAPNFRETCTCPELRIPQVSLPETCEAALGASNSMRGTTRGLVWGVDGCCQRMDRDECHSSNYEHRFSAPRKCAPSASAAEPLQLCHPTTPHLPTELPTHTSGRWERLRP